MDKSIMYGYVDRSFYLPHSTLSFGMSPSSTAHGYIYPARARRDCVFAVLIVIIFTVTCWKREINLIHRQS